MTKECPGHDDPDCRKKLSEHAEKKVKELESGLCNKYVKKPPGWLTKILVSAFFASIFVSLLGGYNIYYTMQTVPELAAAEKETKEKVYKIDKGHAIMQETLQRVINIQAKQVEINQQQNEQMIELKTQFKNEVERSRETDKELLKEIKKLNNGRHDP